MGARFREATPSDLLCASWQVEPVSTRRRLSEPNHPIDNLPAQEIHVIPWQRREFAEAHTCHNRNAAEVRDERWLIELAPEPSQLLVG
jgi:hypothetical protein